MIDGLEHHLRRPHSDDEWRTYHAIRRKVLFESRGSFGVYDENRPDERQTGNHPLMLIRGDEPIGVIRVDVRAQVAWFRRVAIREDLQREGHGRVLLQLAEDFARKQKCSEVRSNVASDAVGFYERCGYSHDFSKSAEIGSIQMVKRLL
jgi:GNAT superfamily N-acetyltransferase